MKNYAIIVAGGLGKRMQSEVPKQFLLLNGIPVLMHTIKAFHRSSITPKIILVLTHHFHDYWLRLCEQYDFTIPHEITDGGFSRSGSVRNGLALIKEKKGIVAIHDGVRPLISQQIIAEAYKAAEEKGNAVAAVRCQDSVRQVNDDISHSLDRDSIYLVQTPQAFQVEQIKHAYDIVETETLEIKEFTDDASIAEEAGLVINLIEGSHSNIKITYHEDLAIAEALINMPH